MAPEDTPIQQDWSLVGSMLMLVPVSPDANVYQATPWDPLVPGGVILTMLWSRPGSWLDSNATPLGTDPLILLHEE
jgi:hypothetical protein